MTDPISGQMASQAVEQMASQQAGGVEKGGSSTDFKDVMSAQGTDNVDGAQGIDAVAEVNEVNEVAQVEAVNEIPTEDFIQSLLREEADINAMMERCLSGASLGPDEMLQMQALIYSYSQRVDLTTKVVEKATSGIQQVMNTQV